MKPLLIRIKSFALIMFNYLLTFIFLISFLEFISKRTWLNKKKTKLTSGKTKQRK